MSFVDRKWCNLKTMIYLTLPFLSYFNVLSFHRVRVRVRVMFRVRAGAKVMVCLSVSLGLG